MTLKFLNKIPFTNLTKKPQKYEIYGQMRVLLVLRRFRTKIFVLLTVLIK